MLIYSDVGFYYLLSYFIWHHDTGNLSSAQAKVCEPVEHDYKKIAYMNLCKHAT